jgi:hypothetical protein
VGPHPRRALNIVPGNPADVVAPPKRKSKAKSPTARSLEHLRKLGFPLVQVVERWNMHAKVRIDLFGIIDIVAIDLDGETFGIQATSGDNVASRVTKIAESDALPTCLKAGWRIVVHGWRKNAAGRWVLREVEL